MGVEHLLFFRIRNELQFVKARKVISLELPPFVMLTQAGEIELLKYYWLRVLYDKCSSVKAPEFCL